MRKRPRPNEHRSSHENLRSALEKLGLAGQDFAVGDLTRRFQEESLRNTLSKPEQMAVLHGFRLEKDVADHPDLKLGRAIQRASQHMRGEAMKVGIELNSRQTDPRYGRN